MNESEVIERFTNEFWEGNGFIKFAYQSKFSCNENGCFEDDHCRCSKIENLECVDINIFELANHIYRILHPFQKNINRKISILNILHGFDYKSINLYFIIRLLTINKLYLNSNWTCKIDNGYYGQELGIINIIGDVFFKLRRDIFELFNKDSLKEKVEHSLILEYGWLIDELRNKTYHIETISKSQLVYPEKTHHLRVQSKNIDYLKKCKFDLPSGIAIKRGDYFYLVDGYHRTTANEKDSITLIIAK
jgi:hypothetical protein